MAFQQYNPYNQTQFNSSQGIHYQTRSSQLITPQTYQMYISPQKFKNQIFNYQKLQKTKPISKEHYGKWSPTQTKLFMKFLKYNIKSFKVIDKRRKRRIFNKMSEHVMTRSSEQCKSHLQKVLVHYNNSIDDLINSYYKNTKQDVQKWYQQNNQKPQIIQSQNQKQNISSSSESNKKLQLQRNQIQIENNQNNLLFRNDQQLNDKQCDIKNKPTAAVEHFGEKVRIINEKIVIEVNIEQIPLYQIQ